MGARDGECWVPTFGGWQPPRALVPVPSAGAEAGLGLGGSWLASHGGERWGPMADSSRRGEGVTNPG